MTRIACTAGGRGELSRGSDRRRRLRCLRAVELDQLTTGRLGRGGDRRLVEVLQQRLRGARGLGLVAGGELGRGGDRAELEVRALVELSRAELEVLGLVAGGELGRGGDRERGCAARAAFTEPDSTRGS